MTLQAAIAAEHAIAPSLAATNWRRVVELYGALLRLEPSPTIAVGRCVAMSHLAGPAQGLADLDEVIGLGGLERYPYAFGARAADAGSGSAVIPRRRADWAIGRRLRAGRRPSGSSSPQQALAAARRVLT